MSRDRGVRLQNALAAYLRTHGWPSAESAGSGRPGSDILGTPGIVWESKTAREFRPLEWVRQANAHADCPAHGKRHDQFARGCLDCPRCNALPVAVYWPTGVGERRPELALAILTLPDLARLLAEREALEQAEMAARDALAERTAT